MFCTNSSCVITNLYSYSNHPDDPDGDIEEEEAEEDKEEEEGMETEL